jgi:hypothetical protein
LCQCQQKRNAAWGNGQRRNSAPAISLLSCFCVCVFFFFVRTSCVFYYLCV